MAVVSHGRFAQLRDHWAKLLRKRYPELFIASRPLAIGIYHQIRAAIGREELRRRDLSLFLAGWTKWPAYRAALARGDRRVNLDGSDAGPALGEPRAA
jgi:sRNA-binding protein